MPDPRTFDELCARLTELRASDVGPSHAILRSQLPADWSAQQLYDNHEILMLHGQKVCHFRKPACYRCVLSDLCPSAFRVT